MTKENFCVYIGKFDPIHRTHVAGALHVAHYFNAHVQLMVSENGLSPQPIRHEITQAAIKGYPKLSVVSENTHFNRSTYIDNLAHKYNLITLVGEDQFEKFTNRQERNGSLRRGDIVITARPGYNAPNLHSILGEKNGYNPIPSSDNGLRRLTSQRWQHKDTGMKITYLDIDTGGISSTFIREELAKGRDISSYLPSTEATNLYLEAQDKEPISPTYIPDSPDQAVGIIPFNEDGKVLIHQLGPVYANAGLFDFPGGGVKIGETPANAAIREIKEEWDLEVELEGILCQIAKGIGTAHDITAFKAQVIGGEPRNREPEKASGYRWINPREIDPNLLTWASKIEWRKLVNV